MSAPRSVFFQQHIQHGVQIGGFYAGVFRFGHGAGEVSLHLAQPLLAQKLQVASGDEGTLALHGVDEAGFFQFRVGPLVVMTLMRKSFARARMEGRGSPSFTSPAMMAALI